MDSVQSSSSISHYTAPIETLKKRVDGPPERYCISDPVELPTTNDVSPLLVFSLFSIFKDICTSVKNRDYEGTSENIVRAANVPIGIASIIEKILFFANQFLRGLVIMSLATAAVTLGTIFIGIEFLIEGFRLLRTTYFSEHYQIAHTLKLAEEIDPNKAETIGDFEKLHAILLKHQKEVEAATGPKNLIKRIKDALNTNAVNVPLLRLRFKEIQEALLLTPLLDLEKDYFSILPKENAHINETVNKQKNLSPEEKQKKIKALQHVLFKKKQIHLARRIGYNTSKNLTKDLAHLFKTVNLKDLNNVDQTISLARKSLKTIRTQSRKIRAVHILGLIGVCMSALALIFGIVACPPAVAIIFTALAIAIQTPRMFASRSFIEQPGYTWSLRAMIPTFLGGKSPFAKHPPPEASASAQN